MKKTFPKGGHKGKDNPAILNEIYIPHGEPVVTEKDKNRNLDLLKGLKRR